MPPTHHPAGPHPVRPVYTLFSITIQWLPRISRGILGYSNGVRNIYSNDVLTKRAEFNPHEPKYIVFAILIPVLVLLSGLFAGLTLGYMSLDETQLNVLSLSGTPQQREYANRIKPIRKNGHRLLVTLLLANMITNESLPVISDPVLGGGVQSVAVSTVLIVIFSEIIPQSLFTRHGLYLGAKCAGLTKFLIYFMGIIAWPVSKILEFVLGSQHGIIYRRAELKELIAMHSSMSSHGGDLKKDTVTIIGATLDLQDKVVEQAMTPISNVFMLSIDSRLDYDLLKKICDTGHSRIPVYEEVNVLPNVQKGSKTNETQKVKKIVGVLLVKQCVLLDPKDATPLRTIGLNNVFFVPKNESLLGILDKFQEGRSHMAIVSRFSVEQAKVVKKVVKTGLTQKLKKSVGMSDSEDETEIDTDSEQDGSLSAKGQDEKTPTPPEQATAKVPGGIYKQDEPKKNDKDAPTKPQKLEQSMPADAVLGKDGANEFLQGFNPAIMPMGIITLEDVLEELIGEEIYDEFDAQGAHGRAYAHTSDAPPPVEAAKSAANPRPHWQWRSSRFRFLRSTTAPPGNRDPSRDEYPLRESVRICPGILERSSTATPNITDTRTPKMSRAGEIKTLIPNPSLEAILLTQNRRQNSGISAVGPTKSGARLRGSPAKPGMKRTFKSGPVQLRGSMIRNSDQFDQDSSDKAAWQGDEVKEEDYKDRHAGKERGNLP